MKRFVRLVKERAGALCIPPVMVAVLCAWSAGSCSVSTEGIEVLAGDYSAPAVQRFSVCGERAVELELSKCVQFEDAQVCVVPDGNEVTSFELLAAGCETIPIADISGSGTQCIRIDFDTSTDVGGQYILYGRLRDGSSNTLTVALPFTGFNAHPPRMILNEVSAKTSSSTAGKKAEFVEFYVLEGGNTAGLELYSMHYGQSRAYSFPAMDVSAGEFITVHCRTYPGTEELCIDETGDDLTLSTALLSCDTARDLWAPGSVVRLAETDVLLLKNTNDGSLIDGVPYCRDESKWTDELRSATEQLSEAGLWASDMPASAAGATATATLSRQVKSVPAAASDWLVVATSNATPGKENSSKPK